jgi:hypothetical protein
LPSVDPRAVEIVHTLGELEASVAAAEDALLVRDWAKIDGLLSDQRRLTQALQNVLEESVDDRPQAFTDEVHRRVAGVVQRRADQLRRLTAFNYGLGQRLKLVSQSREMRRVHTTDNSSPRIIDSLQ